MRAFYSEPGLNVETYDERAAADIAGTSVEGDVAFYLEHARTQGGTVLELGCGTGRVAWSLASAGFRVVGLDLSPHMLRGAESKRAAMPGDVAGNAEFVQGDMCEFDLPRRFDLAIVPFRAFMAITSPEGQWDCLRAVQRHLRPGSRFIVDLFDPRLEWCAPGVTTPPRSDRISVRHPLSGNEVRTEVLSRENDALRQVLTETWRFTELDAGGGVVAQEEEVLTMRWTFRREMHYLLELAGFEVENEFSDFRSSPPAYGREQVWVSRRA